MLNTISPVDNQICSSNKQLSNNQINKIINDSVDSQKIWEDISLNERIDIMNNFLKEIENKKEFICNRLSIEMGRPIRYCYGEIKGLKERANYMISIAKKYLNAEIIHCDSEVTKKIQRVPLGVILIIPAWNYPYLTSINSLITALLSGNSVIFKGSSQTPSVGEIYKTCLLNAGLPFNVFNNLYLDHNTTGLLVSDNRINSVAFTGSVKGGQIISNRANNHTNFGINLEPSIGFKPTVLELGGKDAAYVREDADLEFSASEIAGGTFFNSGQCCCAIERVYVHEKVYDEFVELVKQKAEENILGEPLNPNTTMGPMAKQGSADEIRKKINEAISQGAVQIVNQNLFPLSKPGSNYVAPHILVNVNHTMNIVKEETFGPVMPIIKVKNDIEAIRLINDSKYGLTSSIWSRNLPRSSIIAEELNTGTVFVNRCDYLDPSLPWCGVKETGIGCSLSYLGFHQVTRPKSYYIREIPK